MNVRKLLGCGSLLLLFILVPANANWIHSGYFDKVDLWHESVTLTEHNEMYSDVRVDLSLTGNKSSENFTFYFLPGYSGYVLKHFEVINCTIDGYQLNTNCKDMVRVSKTDFLGDGTLAITIDNVKIEYYTRYSVSFSYGLSDAIKKRGKYYILLLGITCGPNRETNCPPIPNNLNFNIRLPSDHSIIERVPDDAEIKGFRDISISSYGAKQIWYTDERETESYVPLGWAFIGALFGFAIGKVFDWSTNLHKAMVSRSDKDDLSKAVGMNDNLNEDDLKMIFEKELERLNQISIGLLAAFMIILGIMINTYVSTPDKSNTLILFTFGAIALMAIVGILGFAQGLNLTYPAKRLKCIKGYCAAKRLIANRKSSFRAKRQRIKSV